MPKLTKHGLRYVERRAAFKNGKLMEEFTISRRCTRLERRYWLHNMRNKILFALVFCVVGCAAGILNTIEYL